MHCANRYIPALQLQSNQPSNSLEYTCTALNKLIDNGIQLGVNVLVSGWHTRVFEYAVVAGFVDFHDLL